MPRTVSTRKRRPVKRPDSEYIEAAQRLAMFAPSLEKYTNLSELTPHQKSAIARKENLLRYTGNLIPVSEEIARARKNELYIPDRFELERNEKGELIRKRIEGHGTQGVRAMMFNNMGTIRSIETVGDDLMIVSNERPYIFQSLEKQSKGKFKRALRETVEDAFDEPEAYPIERLAELAEAAFEKPKTRSVRLWTKHGPVGKEFRRVSDFLRWMEDFYTKYQDDPSEWVFGIAVRIGDVGDAPDTPPRNYKQLRKSRGR